tara:strand:+ start:784 stop:1005 length:222 start_codon:yes stop_codon:yes gene_type:complete
MDIKKFNMEKTYQTCRLIKNRVDLYLYEMSLLFANLGTDSTLEEVENAYRKEGEYIELIAELDPDKASRLRSS